MERKKFLEYDGLKIYHDELVKKMRDLAYDPQRSFDSQEDLVTLSNWQFEDSRVCGLKKGLLVTVDNKFWQLEEPNKFQTRLTRVGETIEEKSQLKPEELGWKLVGSTTEFDIDGHTLKLIK